MPLGWRSSLALPSHPASSDPASGAPASSRPGAEAASPPQRPDSPEFPGGGANPGETAEDAIRRELREEVDLHAATFEHLGAYVTNMRKFGMRIECFLATGLTEDPLPNDDAEAIAWDWLTPVEVDARIADGTFDSASILSCWALFRARYPR